MIPIGSPIRKISSILITCLTLLIWVLPGPLALGVPLSINGVPRSFLPEAYINGSTAMMPLRPVIETLGGDVSWNSADQSIACRLDGQELIFRLDSPIMEQTRESSRQRLQMPEAAVLCGGVVFVPARTALEALGISISWANNGLAIDKSPVAGWPPNSAETAPAPLFYVSGTTAAQGQILMLWMSPCQAGDQISFTTSIPGARTAFYDYGDQKLKMIGIEKNAPPGSYIYHAVLERAGVRLVDATGTLQVREGDFEVQHLWVDSNMSDMLDSELAAQDDVLIAQALSQSAARPLWQDSFVQPCEGRITTLYGSYRYVNGQSPYQHSGLDIATDYGVPVKAANSGVVTMAATLYVTGNTVVVDHGCGVFSMYYHLQEMYVSPGDAVERNQAIGAVGSTGFSTGPHLHWNMGIDESPLDPYQFVGNDFLSMLGTDY